MTAAEHPASLLVHALDAYDHGLCVIPTKMDGSKAPSVNWLDYQSQRPTREQVIAWFDNPAQTGMGAVCGAVSGDLQMFELEGRFVTQYGATAFGDRMKEHGYEFLHSKLRAGLVVRSPSGGVHIIHRVDGPVDGNVKLARNTAGETLIETRGEGGFVVLAPSHGRVHPSGKPWRTKSVSYADIATITTEERDQLFEVARSFDENPQTPVVTVQPAQRATVSRYTGDVAGSWFDAVADHLATHWELRALLEHYGWTYCYEDRHGRKLLRRPGKDEGVSGSINTNGRFKNFSTSVPFDAATTKLARTYDHLDVIAAYEHGGDRNAAARRIAEDTGILTRWQQAQDAAAAAQFAATKSTPPPGVDPDTGELTTVAGFTVDFWTSREVLEHILTAARNRLVGPAAALGAVLVRIAAWTPPSTCIPAIIGSTSPLSLYVALYGHSGAGKSAPSDAAGDLLPPAPLGCFGPVPLGSGEGMVDAYCDLVDNPDDTGPKKIKKQVRWGGLFSLDEGQALAEIGNRKGSTILPVLRTAWSGGDPGQANASAETRRHLRPKGYAVGLMSSWQQSAAMSLLSDVDGGTPQRFVWLPVDDGVADHDRPDWPGQIDWRRPPHIGQGGVFTPNPLSIATSVEQEIVRHRVAVLNRKVEVAPLDAHRNLNKLKVAGCLTVLDNRHAITEEDWQLAEEIMRVSDGIRDWTLHQSKLDAQRRLAVDAQRAVVREAAVERSAHERALERAAKAVYRAVSKGAGEAVGRRDISRAITSRDRQMVTPDEAIAEAERLRWISGAADTGWRPGDARPT